LANSNPSSVVLTKIRHAPMYFSASRLRVEESTAMEDHIRNHMPTISKPLEDAADDLIEIVRTYLK
jgi:hypothetical protein